MLAHCAVLREQVLRASAACFGHRLLMDCVIPGGVVADLPADGAKVLRALVAELRRRFPPLIELYDNTASLQDRTVGTGFVRPAFIQQFGCGGPIGRAGGRAFDARRQPGYPPYEQLEFETLTLTESDVNARVWLRIREVEQSLALIERILERLPAGPVRGELNHPGQPCEGMALVEGFRGDVLVWLRLNSDGTVARCHPRDPSWFQWPCWKPLSKTTSSRIFRSAINRSTARIRVTICRSCRHAQAAGSASLNNSYYDLDTILPQASGEPG